MRLNLLLHGNFHGVSCNWLSKKLDYIYESPKQFADHNPNNWGIMAEDIHKGKQLYEGVVKNLSKKIYGESYDCESGLASFLYAYILRVKPRVIIETGVANGITTNIIMQALEKTGGELHSFDIDQRCKNVYSGHGNWHFHQLVKPYSRNLIQLSAKISNVGIWLHDSNHGYLWQNFEYKLAYQKLSKDGILVTDDIDSSPAFGEFAKLKSNASVGIFDNRKFFGFIQK